MFNFIEKSLERRSLCNHLLTVGLELSDLGPAIVREIMQILYRQATAVSKKYHEPIHVVSENIICAAAWGIAYCLLGPTKLLDVYPEFKDRTEEAEMELLLMEGGGEMMESSIYQQIFPLLLDSPHCHPEVKSLYTRVRLSLMTPGGDLLGNGCITCNEGNCLM
jgi:hypothetical protein